jgi:hypothetical protein
MGGEHVAVRALARLKVTLTDELEGPAFDIGKCCRQREAERGAIDLGFGEGRLALAKMADGRGDTMDGATSSVLRLPSREGISGSPFAMPRRSAKP